MKIGIVGHFGINHQFNDGQTVKTRNLHNELEKIYGKDSVKFVDTFNWKKKPIKLFFNCKKIVKECDKIIILPARRGVKIFVPLFARLKRKYKKQVFYAVVGGWLPELLESNKKLLLSCKNIDCIFVETNGMIDKMKKLGLSNLDILVNFKKIKKFNNVNKKKNKLINVCTFSRVIKEKGIEDAINVITEINNNYKKEIYHLDIYGPVGDNYKNDFDTIMKNSPSYIEYKGIVDSDKSSEILSKYDFLLFPTYYDGEGLAGTIIDSFFAGVPVIASDWRYNKEIVENKKTGFIYKTHDNNEMYNILDTIYHNRYDIEKIKNNCLKEADKYLPDVAIKRITKYLDK